MVDWEQVRPWCRVDWTMGWWVDSLMRYLADKFLRQPNYF